jgi:hypothetical protein
MAGRIAISIDRGGDAVPVTDFMRSSATHESGLVLDGETSASPRGIGIHLRPLSAGTKEAFSDVQRRHDWVNPRRFELNLSVEEGKLVLAGVDEDSLPPGTYELKVRIGGMKTKPTFAEVKVPKSGDAALRLREIVRRRLVLNRPIEEFDVNSRAVMTHAKSVLDGAPAAEWLNTAKYRDARKAVLLNVLAKLAAIPTARPEESLSGHVEHVFFAEVDRIYCAVSEQFHDVVRGVFRKDAAIDATHRRLLTRIPGGNPDDFDLLSYRERRRTGSLQTVIAVPKTGAADRAHYVDLDIDGANPGQDLTTFFIHVGEILDPGKTDHLRLVKKLDRAQVGDFLYYDVEKV